MSPWLPFCIAGVLLALALIGGFLLRRHQRLPMSIAQKFSGDARFLYLLLWLASLSILAYIAFAFVRR